MDRPSKAARLSFRKGSAAPQPTPATVTPNFVSCTSLLFLQFADCATDRSEVRDPHFFVFAGDHNPVRPGLERLQHALIHFFGIRIEMAVSPGDVESDASIDLGFAFGRSNATPS